MALARAGNCRHPLSTTRVLILRFTYTPTLREDAALLISKNIIARAQSILLKHEALGQSGGEFHPKGSATMCLQNTLEDVYTCERTYLLVMK